jgi:hypothetical protein
MPNNITACSLVKKNGNLDGCRLKMTVSGAAIGALSVWIGQQD